MDTESYLKEVLKNQNLADDSKELKELQKHRADLETLLRGKFNESSPTIRYGGSKAKGTLIKESYDLDMICYFPSDDTKAGDSLADIYNNVNDALSEKYLISKKNSALRVKSKESNNLAYDFHIDVVPGRFTDDSKSDCFIHQNDADKSRMKTNLDTHIRHIKDSGVVEAVRLLKLWKIRKSIPLKQFAWELLVVKLLKGKSSKTLSEQLTHVWSEITNSTEPIKVEDPANPQGNDLSKLFDAGVWYVLSSSASSSLQTVKTSGWESVFGVINNVDPSRKIEILQRAVSAAPVVSKPWSD